MMERDEVFHQEQLLKHCRVCDERPQKTRGRQMTAYSCVDKKESLMKIDISADHKSVHPPQYCKTCHLALGRTMNATAKGVPYRCLLQFFNWTGHTNDCEVGQ